MFDLQKVFVFLEKNNITFEEMGVLLTIYYRNSSKEISDASNRYYIKKETQMYNVNGVLYPIMWKDLVENLIQKGLIEDFRSDREKNNSEPFIKFAKLKVTEKFTNKYFVKKENAYEYALSLYPNFIEVKGVRHQAKAVNHEKYSAIFYQKVIKNGDKEAFDFFVYMTKDLFDFKPKYDENGLEVGGECLNPPMTKWDKYLDGFEILAQDFKERGDVSNNTWNSLI